MSDDDLIRRGDIGPRLAEAGFGGELLQDAIAALPARGVGVKPLEWREARISQEWERWTADVIFGSYEILEYSNGGFGWNVSFFDEDAESLQYSAAGIEAAKAAAQADYEARILAALAPTEYTLAPHLQKIVDGAKTTPQWDMQADRLAPTDAVHVNETPKAEHDADNVLTAAQAREAALREAAKVGADAAFNYWAEAEKPVSQRKYGGAGLPASVSLAILALIGDNNNDK